MAQHGPRTESRRISELFTQCNIFEKSLHSEVAHDGEGRVNAIRLATANNLAGKCHFIDYVELPPGTSVGDHRHEEDEEEFYLVLAGDGLLRLDDKRLRVTAGDLVRNRPGGVHGLINIGTTDIKLFVFELEIR